MGTPQPTADTPPVLDPAEAGNLRHSTILVVDDNAQNVELLQAYLEALPCKTIAAADGVEAMRIIEAALAEARAAKPGVAGRAGVSRASGGGDSGDVGDSPGDSGGSEMRHPVPDLVLLDVMMPRMSGFEVCRKLKEDPATRSIPVMMITALNELGDIERGVESGTDDFLTKPVNKLELITRVKSLLRVRHLKRELDRTMAYIQDIQGQPHVPGGAGVLPGSAPPGSDGERSRDYVDDNDPGMGRVS
jgi:CheY-like chemotaxis protein